jgi:hypothetical protein
MAASNRRAGKKKKTNTNANIAQMRKDYQDTLWDGASFKFQNGATKIRILMNKDNGLFYTPVTKAWIPKGEGDGKVVLTSPRSRDPEAYCPMTEIAKALRARGKNDEARDVNPNTQYFVNGVVMNKDTGDWDFHKIQLPYTVWKGIVGYMIDNIDEDEEDEEGYIEGGGIIADNDEGRIILVRRTQKGQKTEYTVTVTEKKLKATDEWLDKRESFDDETVPATDEAMEDALCDFLNVDDLSDFLSQDKQEEEEDDYDDDDEEEEEEEDDDGEEDEEEDEDVAEEKPRRSRKRTAASSSDSKPRRRRSRS